ncbi:MAG: Zn-ribbon domain-containing OB-fold protein [Candidatus Lokiarchaeia archaeon]
MSEEVVLIQENLFEPPATPSDKPRLFGGKCKSCGELLFPWRQSCPKCRGEVEKIELSSKGKLYSYTIARISTPLFSPPYVIGVVKLPEELKILSRIDIDESDFEKLEIDMDLELTVGEIGLNTQGQRVLSYMFKPVK